MQCRVRTPVFLVACVLAGMSLFGCDQGGPSRPLTAEEARGRITGSAEVLGQAATDLRGGALGRVAGAMTASEGGEPGMSSWGTGLIAGLGAVLDTTGGTFNYDASTGVYAWSEADQAWEQKRPADSLILRFPAAPEADSNSATFTLGRYDARTISVGGRVPTRVEASLSIGGEEECTIRLRDVEFSPILGIPQSFVLETTASSLSYSSSLDPSNGGTGGQSYRYQDRLENDGQRVVATDATIDAFSEEQEGDGPIGDLEGTTRIGQDLAVEYTVEVGALTALGEEASAEDISDSVDIKILHQGEQVATLQHEGSADGASTDEALAGQVVVAYPDGETEPLSDLLRDLGL